MLAALKRDLVAVRGTIAHLARHSRLWVERGGAARLLWAAHRGQWDDDRRVPVALTTLTCDIRARDWFALRDVWLAEEYQAAVALLPEAPVVIDVGANVGLFAAYVFSRRPRARVLSVEPSADSFALLRSNIERNAAFGWRAHEAALWTHEGRVRLTQVALSSGRRVSPDGDLDVEAVSVDALVRDASPPVDLLKLDIEGAEEVVATDVARAHQVARVIVELHPDRCDASFVIATLSSAYHGYRLARGQSQKPLLLFSRAPLDRFAEGLVPLS